MSDVATRTRRPPRAGAQGRGDGRIGGDRQNAVRPVGAGMAARRPDLGRHGHDEGQDTTGLDTETHCRRDVVGAGGERLEQRGGPLGVAPPSSDQSTPSSPPLAGSLSTSSSASCRAGIGLGGVGLVGVLLSHARPDTQTQSARLRSWAIQSLGTRSAGPGAGWSSGWQSGAREFRPVVVLVGVVVPEPVLAWLERPDDGMPGGAPVRRCVAGQRVVAAADVAARGAAAKVHPPPADRIALDTPGPARRDGRIDGITHSR